MSQTDRSEEGDSGGDQTPQYVQDPDSSNLSTNDRDTKEGQTEQLKDPNLQAQGDIRFGGSQDKINMQTVTMGQTDRSEEGDSHCYQAPRYVQDPDSPGSSPTSHSVSDDGGAEEDQKNHQGKKKKRNDPESSSPEESQDKQGWLPRDVSDFVTRRYWSDVGKKIKEHLWKVNEKPNPVNQPLDSCNNKSPPIVPPQALNSGMICIISSSTSSHSVEEAPEPYIRGQQSKHLKRIFYYIDGEASWLIDQLKDESIPGYDFITCHTLEELKAEKCSLVILCLSHKSSCEGNVKEFLEWSRKPVIGVITGLENRISEQEKREYWENVTKDLSSKFDLITLTKQDENIIRTKNSETQERLDTKMKVMKDILQNSAAKNPLLEVLQKTKVDIGIFSRSDESDYSWLVELLRSADFSDRVQSVTPCYISNSGRQKFREDVSKCNVGILYHTKNRGRINVTDVTDALYDEELGYLSGKLGKDNVIVVIDNMEDSSDTEKKRILQSQRSIKNRARGLFLFSHDEKRIASAERKITQLRAMITDSKDLSSEASGGPPSPGTP